MILSITAIAQDVTWNEEKQVFEVSEKRWREAVKAELELEKTKELIDLLNDKNDILEMENNIYKNSVDLQLSIIQSQDIDNRNLRLWKDIYQIASIIELIVIVIETGIILTH